MLIKRCSKRAPYNKETVELIPLHSRGIYVLLKQDGRYFNVYYLGMSSGQGGMRNRLLKHLHSKRKSKCTHFEVFEVHENISEREVKELEGFLRHIFRGDAQANSLGKQRAFQKLKSSAVRFPLKDWSES
jgi:hypothetical protein